MNRKPTDTFSYFSFVYLGVCCLLSWNVILTSMNLFEQIYKNQFPEYSPTFLFPNMNFILNLTFQFYLVSFGNKFSYFIQLMFALIVMVLTIGLLPIVALSIPGIKGYSLCCVLIALQGFGNSIFQSNLFGIAGYLPAKFIIGVSYGNGIAGISVGVLQYILLFSYGINNSDDPNIVISSSYWFFSVSVLVLIIGTILLFANFKNPWFINALWKVGSKEFSEEKTEAVRQAYFKTELADNEEKCDSLIPSVDPPQENSKQSVFRTFLKLMKQLYKLNICILLVYTTTFSLFPGLIFDLELL